MKLLLFGLGMQEVLIIALIVLLLFGGKKIPELMNGLGKGVKSFKDGLKDEEASSNPSKGRGASVVAEVVSPLFLEGAGEASSKCSS